MKSPPSRFRIRQILVALSRLCREYSVIGEPDTDDGENTPDSLAMDNTDNHAGDEEGGYTLHEDEVLLTRTLTGGNGGYECSGSRSDIGSDAPSPSSGAGQGEYR